MLSDISNLDLIANDRSWTQASLPVKSDGIVIRRGAQLATSAFLASAAGSFNLIQQILPFHLKNNQYTYYKIALENWTRDMIHLLQLLGMTALKRHGTPHTCRPPITAYYYLPPILFLYHVFLSLLGVIWCLDTYLLYVCYRLTNG